MSGRSERVMERSAEVPPDGAGAQRGAGRTNGLTSLSRAMFLGFLRDRTALFFTVVFPLLFLVLFGGLFKDAGASKSEVLEIGSVAILDQMPAEARRDIEDVLAVTKTSDRDAALDKVRKGDIDAAVEQQGNTLVVHYSAADQVKAGTIQGLFNSLVENANVAATGRPPTFQLQTKSVEDESLSPIQFLTPGLLGWAISIGGCFGAALTLVTWRQKKILRRLRLAPVSTGTVVSARVGVAIAIGLAQMAVFVGVASIPYFGLQLSDYWWMAVPVLIAGTLAFLSIGLLVGAFAKTPESASAVANLIILPMAFLSGSFFPLDDAPGWVKGISKIFPLHYLVDGMQNVMVRGEGPASALPAIGILLGFALVVGFIATRMFRWDDV